jgi:hypothetical protein
MEYDNIGFNSWNHSHYVQQLLHVDQVGDVFPGDVALQDVQVVSRTLFLHD